MFLLRLIWAFVRALFVREPGVSERGRRALVRAVSGDIQLIGPCTLTVLRSVRKTALELNPPDGG
jgi:hypothetical protein